MTLNLIKQINFKELTKDIRFWIFIFFIVRLFGITNPPIEVAHNWRQTTVTMVARNFYEVDNNIFYPRIDIAGEKSGITGMEFPLLNYLIYLISLVFGYSHWYGRLMNLIVSSIGIYFFYKIIKKYFSHPVAFNASILLLVSVWFAYSRKIMPDTFSMSLVLIGFYYGSWFLDSEKLKIKYLLLYFIFILLGVLSKLPSGYLLVVFALFMFNRSIGFNRKLYFAFTSILLLIPVFAWYYYWVPYLVNEYGFWHFFMGKGLVEGFHEIYTNWSKTLARFYDSALKFTGFASFLAGIIIIIKTKNKMALWVFILSFLAFAMVVFKSGYTFPHHTYYVIPFVPVMALIAGIAISLVPKRWMGTTIMIIIALEGIANQQDDFIMKKRGKELLTLEADLDNCSKRNDLIVINSGEVPTPMYFAHRKGWVASNDDILKPEMIEQWRQKGCKFIVILKNNLGKEISLNFEKVFDGKDYTIYKIDP